MLGQHGANILICALLQHSEFLISRMPWFQLPRNTVVVLAGGLGCQCAMLAAHVRFPNSWVLKNIHQEVMIRNEHHYFFFSGIRVFKTLFGRNLRWGRLLQRTGCNTCSFSTQPQCHIVFRVYYCKGIYIKFMIF